MGQIIPPLTLESERLMDWSVSWGQTGLDLDSDQVNKASRNVETGHPLPPPEKRFHWRGGPNREENF